VIQSIFNGLYWALLSTAALIWALAIREMLRAFKTDSRG
jgi:hypothetical protein